MNQEQEIKLLKATVKALSKLVLHYRIGNPAIADWVFSNLEKAYSVYGDDLTKIK